MKNLFLLMVLTISQISFGSELNTISVGRWASYPKIFESTVTKIELALNQNLKPKLDCDHIKVCAYQISRKEYNALTEFGEDNWLAGITYKYYKLDIKASCNQNFSDLKIHTFFSMDWGDETIIRTSVKINNAQEIKDEFSVPADSYPNTQGDYEYNHSGCK